MHFDFACLISMPRKILYDKLSSKYMSLTGKTICSAYQLLDPYTLNP